MQRFEANADRYSIILNQSSVGARSFFVRFRSKISGKDLYNIRVDSVKFAEMCIPVDIVIAEKEENENSDVFRLH